MAKLSFFGVDGEERSYTLHPQLRLRIGRDPGNDVVLRDPKVSRRHAEVVFERGFFVLHDLQSANGTYLNGRRVNVAPLTHGAELKLGNSHGRFEDAPEAAVPKGTVMGRENPDGTQKRGTAEMPPEEWQTHPHQKAARRADYPVHSAHENRRTSSSENLGDTSLMEEASDDESEPESRRQAESPFEGNRFEIQRGVPWGESTSVTGNDGKERLFYRRTFNLVGFVASVVSLLVLLAGAVVAIFLALDGRPILGGFAAGITVLFTFGIMLLVPRRSLLVTLDKESRTPAMMIRELSLPGLPNPVFEVRAAEGSLIGYLRKRTFAGIPARRWVLLGPAEEQIGTAKEDGLIRPFFRKFLGDFFGALTTDYRIVSNGSMICRVIRRTQVGTRHAVVIENVSRKPDARLILAFAFTIDLVEKSR
jgi:hypothetical protein